MIISIIEYKCINMFLNCFKRCITTPTNLQKPQLHDSASAQLSTVGLGMSQPPFGLDHSRALSIVRIGHFPQPATANSHQHCQ